jgi:hypothetical protein
VGDDARDNAGCACLVRMIVNKGVGVAEEVLRDGGVEQSDGGVKEDEEKKGKGGRETILRGLMERIEGEDRWAMGYG